MRDIRCSSKCVCVPMIHSHIFTMSTCMSGGHMTTTTKTTTTAMHKYIHLHFLCNNSQPRMVTPFALQALSSVFVTQCDSTYTMLLQNDVSNIIPTGNKRSTDGLRRTRAAVASAPLSGGTTTVVSILLCADSYTEVFRHALLTVLLTMSTRHICYSD